MGKFELKKISELKIPITIRSGLMAAFSLQAGMSRWRSNQDEMPTARAELLLTSCMKLSGVMTSSLTSHIELVPHHMVTF